MKCAIPSLNCYTPFSLTSFRDFLSSYAKQSSTGKITQIVEGIVANSSPDVLTPIHATVTPFAYSTAEYLHVQVRRLTFAGQNPSARILITFIGGGGIVFTEYAYFGPNTQLMDLTSTCVFVSLTAEPEDEVIDSMRWDIDASAVSPAEFSVSCFYTNTPNSIISFSTNIWTDLQAILSTHGDIGERVTRIVPR